MSDSLEQVRKESALHRAFQLQPECVLGEDAVLLDLDCGNLVIRGKKSRPDGVAALKDGRLVCLEFKLDASGDRDTTSAELACSMSHRMDHVTAHVGPVTARRMHERYQRRFVTGDGLPTDLGEPLEPARAWAWGYVYVIAARSFRSRQYVKSVIDQARRLCKHLPPFELRLIELHGGVSEYGKVHLTQSELVDGEVLRGGAAYVCRDDAELSSELDWKTIPGVCEFGLLLEEHLHDLLPDLKLRSKPRHNTGGLFIGMAHVWGLHLGDVAFEVNLRNDDPHCQLYFGKREDLTDRVHGVVPRMRSALAALGDKGKAVEIKTRGSYVFKVRFKPGSSHTDMARRFSEIIRLAKPEVDPFIW